MIDRQLHVFNSIAYLLVFIAIYEDKRLRKYWNIVQNKLVNGLEINLKCVIITFNHGGFEVFNDGCSPES